MIRKNNSVTFEMGNNKLSFESLDNMKDCGTLKNVILVLSWTNLISMCFSSHTQKVLCYPDLRNKRSPNIYLFQDFWTSRPANSYVNFLLPYALSRLLNLPLPHEPKSWVLCSTKSSKWKFLLNLHHCWSFTASFKNIENKNHLNSAAWLYNSSKLNLKCACPLRLLHRRLMGVSVPMLRHQ